MTNKDHVSSKYQKQSPIAPGYFGKRVIDLVFALVGIIALSPIIGILTILVRWKMGSPVFFAQIRPGINGRLFTIYKFRTMLDAYDKHGNLLPDSERLTPVGLFLRNTSLDELPELLNVIKGDMSLVGPRPLMPQYLERYTARQMRRHEVKPGITGWAQIKGRNFVDWETRFELDVWYVEHKSLLLDLSILIKTVYITLKREGVSAQGHATMPQFMGISLSNKQQTEAKPDDH